MAIILIVVVLIFGSTLIFSLWLNTLEVEISDEKYAEIALIKGQYALEPKMQSKIDSALSNKRIVLYEYNWIKNLKKKIDKDRRVMRFFKKQDPNDANLSPKSDKKL